MKITDIRIHHVDQDLEPAFHAAWDPSPRTTAPATVVRVHTDEGIVGTGGGDTMLGFAAYEHLFLGSDPLRINEQVRRLETISFHGGRYWPLEAALWDILGQVCEQPVATLFGGSSDRLPVYASTGERKPTGARVEGALQLHDEGFRAMKLRIDRDHLAEGIDTVAAVREAVGDGMDLMVDLNQAWRMPGDVEPALDIVAVRRTADRLAELGVLWLEEPLPGSDLADLALLRSDGRVRVAAGEMTRTVPEFLAHLEGDTLDVYQPDVVLAVGLSRARLVAELALAKNRWFTPHTWTDGLGLLANLHVAAGVGGGPYLEYPYDPPGWTPQRRDFMLAEPLAIDAEGCLRVPDAPGLGANLAEEIIR